MARQDHSGDAPMSEHEMFCRMLATVSFLHRSHCHSRQCRRLHRCAGPMQSPTQPPMQPSPTPAQTLVADSAGLSCSEPACLPRCVHGINSGLLAIFHESLADVAKLYRNNPHAVTVFFTPGISRLIASREPSTTRRPRRAQVRPDRPG